MIWPYCGHIRALFRLYTHFGNYLDAIRLYYTSVIQNHNTTERADHVQNGCIN